MMRFVPSVLTALVSIAVLGGEAGAQPIRPKSPSPPPKPANGGPPGLIADLLPLFPISGDELIPDFRLRLSALGKMPSNDADQAQLLKSLIDRLPKDQKAEQKDIRELLEKNPQFKDPALLRQLKELSESPRFPQNLEGKLPPEIRPPTPEEAPKLGENLKQVIQEGERNSSTVPQGGPKGDRPDPSRPDVPQSDPSKLDPKTANPSADNEWAKWLEKNFGDSPAGQAALKDLLSSLEKQDMKGMFDQVPEFKNGAWKDLEGWGKSNAGDLWKMKPPDLSSNKGPSANIGDGPGGTSLGGGGGGPAFGGGGGDGIGGGGTALAVMVGIAGGILLAILLLRKWKLARAERTAAGGAGKNGIDFDSIRSREELVRAFDHVSLDQIGEVARSWNHRAIAGQFAEALPARAEPAGELAGLYERARYAPFDEDLTPGEFADARRDLRAIAGVST